MSLDWQDRYQPPREPERTLRRFTREDIPAALALFRSVGWQHDAVHWEQLLDWSPDGCFALVEPENRIVGTVSTTPYGTDLGWIGSLVVAPDRQKRGLGQQLMRAALDHLITRGTARIMLDASEAGRSMYRKLGFRELYKVERWEGKASTYLGPRARRMRPADVDAVLALDTVLFGLNRAPILTRLLNEYPDLAWVDEAQGKLEGYLLGRRVSQGFYLGPWMSWSAASAERLLRIALEQLQGQIVSTHLPDHNARSQLLARHHNFSRVRHCTRMIYGDAVPIQGQPLSELAITSFATG
jgi:ribosomal protein S18 acetylase RimI-like enzyme